MDAADGDRWLFENHARFEAQRRVAELGDVAGVGESPPLWRPAPAASRRGANVEEWAKQRGRDQLWSSGSDPYCRYPLNTDRLSLLGSCLLEIMTSSDPKAFYDTLTEFYDLIFEDWNVSMQRQGNAIAELIARLLPDATPPIRVLDATAGIGTQSLPLAQLGFDVTCRDLSAEAIARLQREASARGVSIQAGTADIRSVNESVATPFDVAIAFDNSLAHLLTDGDLLTAFQAIFRALRPGGVCLFSVRDYDRVSRGTETVHAYGVRWRGGVRHLPVQVWRWVDHAHYDATFHVVVEDEIPVVHSTTTRFHAFSVSRLLELLGEAGFLDCSRMDETVYQPIISARRP